MKKHGGFTLIEVMMAMTVLAIAGITVLRTTGESLNNTLYLENRTLARWVADNELTSLRLARHWPASSWNEENREMANRTWYVRYRSIETGDSAFRAVEVEVRLVANEKEPPLSSLRTYMTSRA